MMIQEANDLLKKICSAKNVHEVQLIINDNIMWCDGVFFSQLDLLVQEFERRADDKSASALKGVGDIMARQRFMI
ncbi:MAG: hypothetical protein B6242_08405 [Anaerolineaceae bacterium 4572_78]|nr:MAG: hypothetical protein B6242_08405 [Anaerolineaceae bacterium 4572_78]